MGQTPTPEVDSPLLSYLRILQRRWWMVLATFAVTVGAAVVFTSQQTRIYQAAATVLIEPEPPRVVNIPDVANDTSGSQDYYSTQYRILQSRPVIEAVIKDLKLKGSSKVVKMGTKVKNIRLVDSDHDIDCKIDGIGQMSLKSQFVRKA